MLTAALRFCLICALTMGLSLPKMGAVLAAVMPGVHTVVICTGADLVTVTLDATGTPIETDIATSHPCTLADQQPLTDNPQAAWVQIVYANAYRLSIAPAPIIRTALFDKKRPSRAPPVSV